MKEEKLLSKTVKKVFKRCHVCDHVNESHKEPERCTKCRKAFLPTNYFEKIHASQMGEYSELFADIRELEEENLVKGLFVLW